MRPVPRLLLLALAAGALAPTAAHASALQVRHEATTYQELGEANGIIDPGEALDLTEVVRSFDQRALTGLTGVLTGSESVSVLTDGATRFADLPAGRTSAPLTPFRAFVSASAQCGERLDFQLQLRSGADDAVLPFSLVTGAPGSFAPHDAGRLPATIPDGTGTSLESPVSVASPGRVRGLQVRIGRLEHPDLDDLSLVLVAPSGRQVTLLAAGTARGADLVNTTFSATGQPIAARSGPYTGSFRPAGDLADLDGEPLQGTWTLRATDRRAGNAGRLLAWGTDIAPAQCSPKPVASFTAAPDPVRPGEPVTLDASSSSDPAGAITSYDWDLDGDGTYETSTGARSVLTTSWPTHRRVVVGLRVQGPRLTATTTRAVSVTAPPTASFAVAPAAPTTGEDVVLDASASSDEDGPLAEYAWDLDGDGTTDVAGPEAVRTVRFARSGPRTVHLRVTDADGATAVDGADVDVANRAPTAALVVPAPAIVGQPAHLDATGSSDPDGTVDHVDWDLDGDGTADRTTTGLATDVTWPTSGTRAVTATVVDDLGARDAVSRAVRATDAPIAALLASPARVRPRVATTLDASGARDPDGSVVAYAWDLDGDGSFETDGGSSPTRAVSWATPGARRVGVRVTDDDGARATATATVDVHNEAPVAALVLAPTTAVVGAPVRVDASASRDAEGPVARYAFDLDGNGSFETDAGSSPTVTTRYPNAATVPVGVRVTDADGTTARAEARLVVREAPAAPTTSTPATSTPTTTTPVATPPPASSTSTPPASTPAPPVAATTTSPAGPALVLVPVPVPAAVAPAVPAPVGAPAPPVASFLAPASQRLRTTAKRGLVVGCRADRAVTCALVVEVAAKDARRLGLKAKRRTGVVRIGTVVVRTTGPAGATARVRLPAAARRALGRSSVRVSVRGTATDAAGRAAFAGVVSLRS